MDERTKAEQDVWARALAARLVDTDVEGAARTADRALEEFRKRWPPVRVPVAEPSDASEAAHAIVQAHHLIGRPGIRRWSHAVGAALKALHPQAAAHLEEHDAPGETLDEFWPEVGT